MTFCIEERGEEIISKTGIKASRKSQFLILFFIKYSFLSWTKG